MSNIVFCFPPIPSTINSSLRLAKELELAGHHVTYIGIQDCNPIVRSNGFEFVPVYRRWFPQGCFENVYLKLQNFKNTNEFSKAREHTLRFNDFLDYMMSGGDEELKAVIEKLNPDLIVLSPSLSDSIIWALFFFKFKLKVVYMFGVLGGGDYTVPPVCTGFVADNSLLSSIKTAVIWFFFKINKIYSLIYMAYCGLDLISFNKLREVIKYCGCSFKEIYFLSDMPGPQLKFPELVLFPKQFDFPGARKEGRYYAEASIDLSRVEPEFPWEKINDNKPIVYVALGSLSLLAKSDYEKFFRIVIETSASWPQWNWVLSVGNELNINDFRDVPEHVIIVNRTPQLKILKKSILMISHGGAGSVKECIYFGVPMIAFPLWFDHPGNVARITHHGLGLKGNFKGVTKKKLYGLVKEVTSNPKFHKNIKLMQKYFIDVENKKSSIKFIEEVINQYDNSLGVD